jgi:alanyl-tRNA synthetase
MQRDLRQQFLGFFERHGHTQVKSSPLIPQGDPTLMFVNAGMVQFKDVFTGEEKRSYKRATTCQKCLRVSGKHNDLEEVGRTARHHTFFEMLGNFSFGDYFKEQAIVLAWDFMSKEVGLKASRLWFTVFGGAPGIPADQEARQLWKKVTGCSEHRIIDMGMKENFWQMGDTGPCGPCTEIHYDLVDDGSEPSLQDFETGRVVEIWNNVFMQFNRHDGILDPLPAPSVDTGMGLERLTAVVQGELSNYHTPLFMPLLEFVADKVGKKYAQSASDDDVSMRVIADHARAAAHLISDGVQPSNEGRGYVLRRLMRRAIRHGKRLGFNELFFAQVCSVVVQQMQSAYPELREAQLLIDKVATLEEENFRRTLESGLSLLNDAVKQTANKTLAGELVFKLYDTYGFPKDLTEVIAHEHRLQVDEAGFDKAMQAQKERSRQGDVGNVAVASVYKGLAQKLGAIKFTGYTHEDAPLSDREGVWRLQDTYLQNQTTIVALLQHGVEVQDVVSGEVEVVINPTPFYGESGGQVGDKGLIVADGLKVEVVDTIKPVENLTVSRGRLLQGRLQVGQTVWAGYHPQIRKETRAHHSATHLLHASLRQVLGEHVKQAGSLVDPHHLRFDYAHFEAPQKDQMRAIEQDANARIAAASEVVTEVMPFAQAKQKGAIALFGEKYGDTVRVLTMGTSVEFCGGTHARNTRDIDLLLVTGEEAVSSGVRRIEAECSQTARQHTQRDAHYLEQAAALLRGESVPFDNQAILQAVAKAVAQYQEQAEKLHLPHKTMHVQAPKLSAHFDYQEARLIRDIWLGFVQLANARATDVDQIVAQFADPTGLLKAFADLQKARRDNERRLAEAERGNVVQIAKRYATALRQIAGVPALTLEVPSGTALKDLADALRQIIGSCLLCLATKEDTKVSLLIAVTPDLTARFNAGTMVKTLAPCIDGRGGGKAEMAQAGGNKPEGLEQAFKEFEKLIATQG